MPELRIANSANDLPGALVTFEGGDGAGKSTHMQFLANVLRDLGFSVLTIREPGGTSIGEQLRAILLDPRNPEMTPRAELLIYEAARAQLVDEVMRPALEAGRIVLCDRFTDSTLAYQGHARGLDLGLIEELSAFATDGIRPDKTILITCADRSARKDRVGRRADADRIDAESDGFHRTVGEAFELIARSDPERIAVVDSSGTHAQTAHQIFHALADVFPWLSDGTIDLNGCLELYERSHDKASRLPRARTGAQSGS